MAATSVFYLVLYILFFLSGSAALIYQIMWQRMLFTIFGVDLISITIIVSVFMFGLGMGGLLGGELADLMPAQRLKLYILLELLIAMFGFCSPTLINSLGSVMFADSVVMTACASFMILGIPTILMGATFPVLVTEVNSMTQNIGESVGSLYFVNTLGAALGAYFGGFVILSVMTVSGAIYRAATLNLIIAAIALVTFRRQSSCSPFVY